MDKEEIYKKANELVGLSGMTGNERLCASGLIGEFERCKKEDKHKARIILQALRFDELSISRLIGNTIADLKYPNAWDFPPENSNRRTDTNKAILHYSNLNEIAMGAPLGGICKLLYKESEKILIDKRCGGPAIWEDSKLKVVIPIWESSFFSGTFQRIGVFDLTTYSLTKYKKKFRVLDLRFFNNGVIRGYDSPIHRMREVNFDINKERIINTLV
ncbi:hypothetical protein [Labilibacter marinus]|uniref:hypothetical protein n=1 Tax=Labilibacter marinus TaxID=1477105 RepID=UPI000832FC67|nr:hypothetical protein [Labilibacter marinus]